MRQHQLPAWTTMDVFAPGIALGHSIGRIGCFLAGCCYGSQCDRPWAVTYDVDAYKMTGVPPGVPLHPAQLYESAFNLALFGFLYWLFPRSQRPGEVFGLYLALYSLFRFCVEFVRHHEQALTWSLSNTQWISVATLAVGIWIWRRAAVPQLKPVG
jgi:phosphatidylglycerol:prolipoprotein diacylglycerol transferase